MFRDPVALRASNYYEWMCNIGAWVRRWQAERGYTKDCPPTVNLTEVAYIRWQKAKKDCATSPNKAFCKSIALGENPFHHCSSVDALLESPAYDRHFNEMYQSFLVPTNATAPITPPENRPRKFYQELELHALRDLGGFVDADPMRYKLDYIWFGITERMHESMCLFYYTFQNSTSIQPHHAPDMTNERFKPCRPKALWQDHHAQKVKEREPYDYTIWKVANAIMDVRILLMQRDVERRMANGETLESISYLAPRCYPL